MAGSREDGMSPLTLKEFIEKNELPAVVEITSVEGCSQPSTDDGMLREGDIVQLVRTTEEAELVLDPEYVVPTTKAVDIIGIPLDYTGTFNTLPFYGVDYTFDTVTDLLTISPRYVKVGIAFDIPGVTKVECGDVLEVLSKVQCADNNIYLQCKHQIENKEIILPLDFEGGFTELCDLREYTIGELYKILPKKVKFSAATLCSRLEGGLAINGLAKDMSEEMLLRKLTKVEVIGLESTGGSFRIPLDFPINVSPSSRYSDEDFTQIINIHDVIKLGEQLPLVVKVMDQAPVIPGVSFNADTLLQIHSLNFTNKILARDENGRHFLIPNSYNGKFCLPPRKFATAKELWDARIRSNFCVKKSCVSTTRNFDSVFEGDILNIRGVSNDAEDEIALICSKEVHSGHKIVRLPLNAAGDFELLESDILKPSQIQRERSPVDAYVEELPLSPQTSDVLRVGDKITILNVIQSCAVLVSPYDTIDADDDLHDNLHEVMGHFSLRVKPLPSLACRAKSSGIHLLQRIEELSAYQLDIILSAVDGGSNLSDGNVKPIITKSQPPLSNESDKAATIKERQLGDTGNVDSSTSIPNEQPQYFVLEKPTEIPPDLPPKQSNQILDEDSQCTTTNTRNNSNEDKITGIDGDDDDDKDGPLYVTLEQRTNSDVVHSNKKDTVQERQPKKLGATIKERQLDDTENVDSSKSIPNEQPQYFVLGKPTEIPPTLPPKQSNQILDEQRTNSDVVHRNQKDTVQGRQPKKLGATIKERQLDDTENVDSSKSIPNEQPQYFVLGKPTEIPPDLPPKQSNRILDENSQCTTTNTRNNSNEYKITGIDGDDDDDKDGPLYVTLEQRTNSDVVHRNQKDTVQERQPKKLGRRRVRLSNTPEDAHIADMLTHEYVVADKPKDTSVVTDTLTHEYVVADKPKDTSVVTDTLTHEYVVAEKTKAASKEKIAIPPKDDNISEFTMRDVGLLLRYLQFREEVITKFYKDRIDGRSCCNLATTDLQTRYQMKQEEIALLGKYIDKSKPYTKGRNIYQLS